MGDREKWELFQKEQSNRRKDYRGMTCLSNESNGAATNKAPGINVGVQSIGARGISKEEARSRTEANRPTLPTSIYECETTTYTI